jgi:hypothetical protein
LIRVKIASGLLPYAFKSDKGGRIMPMDVAITVAGITAVFAVFAISLAWASFYTRNVQPTRE